MHTLFLIIHYLNVYIYHFSHIVCNDTHLIYCCNKFGVCDTCKVYDYTLYICTFCLHIPVLSSFVNDSQLCVSRHSFNNKQCLLRIKSVVLQYWIFFTLHVSHSATKRQSRESTHKPHVPCKPQLWMKRRKCPSLFMMWIRWLSLSDVRMLAWLSVVMPRGSNNFRGVEGGPMYLKRSSPSALTTTIAPARLSATQKSQFLFSLRFFSP